MKGTSYPYKYVAIEGNIGAGKTTLAKLMQSYLQTDLILEQFSDNPFLSSFYENPERHAFSVELFFMAERHKQFQEYFSKPSLFSNDLVISDYIFQKTVLFAKNNLEEEEFRLFQRLFSVLESNFPSPDLVIFLYRDIDYLIQNITDRGRSYEQQISPQYLLEIQQAYLSYFKTVTSYPIIVMDIGNLDFADDELFMEKIKKRISTPYKPGLHYIN